MIENVTVAVYAAGGTAPIATLPVTGGSVSADETRAARRTATLTLPATTGLIPTQPGDLLHPDTGNELRISRDGQPQGVYVITKPTLTEDGGGRHLSLDLEDRSWRIRRARWTAPYPISDGTSLPTAVHDLINNRMPGLTYNLAPSSATVPATVLGVQQDNTVDTNSDPWADAAKLANAGGMEILFDRTGAFVMRPIPDPTTQAPVAAFVDGDGGTLVTLQRDFDATTAYNTVIAYASGAAADPSIRATSQVSPAPTVVIPYFFASPMLTTQAAAQTAADSLLRRVSRSKEEVQVTCIPDPARDAGDVVTVRRTPAGVNARYAIRSLTLPLDPASAMTVVCRPQ